MTGNVNAPVGVSTFNDLEVTQDTDLLGNVGIGTLQEQSLELQ